MAKMKGKHWDKSEAPKLERKLIVAKALCELLLPVYWNTQVKHMLKCRFIPQLNKFGSFWAIAMLIVESYHILIKNCGRSRKNLMASVVKNYEIFDSIHTVWDVDNKSVQEEIVTRYDMYPERPIDTSVSLGTRQKKIPVEMGDTDYLKVMRLYTNKGSDVSTSLLSKYVAAVENNFRRLPQWAPHAGVLTPAECKLKEKICDYETAKKNKTHVRMYTTIIFRSCLIFSYLFRSSYLFRTSYFFVLYLL